MVDSINNIKIDNEKCIALVSINPEIYPLDVVYSAAYSLLDRAYILLDGNPKEEILVQIKAKNASANISIIADEFNNELLNYAVYKTQFEKNKEIRRAILNRVLLTGIQIQQENNAANAVVDKKETKESDYKEDPEGIFNPFNEK